MQKKKMLTLIIRVKFTIYMHKLLKKSILSA